MPQTAGVPNGYDENQLQDIIDRCPVVLPIKEFLPDARAAVALGREIPVELGGGKTGCVDNLLVTDSGHLVVVETKLWRNSQALREVVAQVLHYGMALMAMSVPALEEAVRKSDAKSKNRLSAQESIADRVRAELGASNDIAAFDDRLDRHMRSGEMLFLIVGDGVHQGVERFASWLGDFKALPFKLGLIELRFFSASSVGTVVVPRTLLKTKEVARHVVTVEMSAETSSQVTATIEDTIVQEGGGVNVSTTTLRPGVQMDESKLLALVRSQASPTAARFVSDLITLLKQAGFDSRGTLTELVFGVRDLNNEKVMALLSLQTLGMYATQSTRLLNIVQSEALYAHRRALNQLAPFYTLQAMTDPIAGSRKGCLVPK